MQDKNVVDVNLSQEMKTSFIDYAMSVIVARALPDVRDGLKPIHRRILYGMNDLGATSDKPTTKSANISGHVMGKFHPHGDSAIYDSMVRMGQWWSYRHLLVDKQGNFGNIDGEGAAAARYTEARLSKIAMEMLRDINKETVDFQDNYLGDRKEPLVLPARFPNLLVNGTTGIAVGMATNIPPHHLGEAVDAVKLLLENPDATTKEIMQVMPGPDFPTGGYIMGRSGIYKAYETGRGSIIMRAKHEIEVTRTGRERIVITELPYMVNKARLVKHIGELSREKKLEGLTALRDETSDKVGIRVVMEVHSDASASVVLNNLYKLTSLQTSFGINMLAIVDKEPKILSLRDILGHYIAHQMDVITRRTRFDKEKAEARAHILEGLLIALDNIDRVIAIIRGSETDQIAQDALTSEFNLSERQAQAILDMRLRRLTSLESEKIQAEYDELVALIADLIDILAKPERVKQIIIDEMADIKQRFADERRTEILNSEALSVSDEELIEEENVIITLSNKGYVKRLNNAEFSAQKRGGKGVKATGLNEDDFIKHMVSTSTHDHLLFFTNSGRVLRMKGYEIPEYGRAAKGIPIVNLLSLEEGEQIQTVINVAGASDDSYLFFTTKLGVVKRTNALQFANIRANGLRALKLREGDSLINVMLIKDEDEVILGTSAGYSVRFASNSIRDMGRTAAGVKGVTLRPGDVVVGSSTISNDQEVLVISENGLGKRTAASEYPTKNRGGKGIKVMNVTEKTGHLAGLTTVNGDEDLMMITNTGITIRTQVSAISQTGRSTQGVKLMRLDGEATVMTFALVMPDDEKAVAEDASDAPIN